MSISIFDLFTIGIGPSSSHTVGPMRAAHRFALELEGTSRLAATHAVRSELFGSLGLTGRAHGTETGVLLGLEGHTPEDIDPDSIPDRIAGIRSSRRLTVLQRHVIDFDEGRDVHFNDAEVLPAHSNGMRFIAQDANGAVLLSRVYYSIGGGFVVDEHTAASNHLSDDHTPLPYPLRSGEALLRLGAEHNLSVSAMTMENEKTWRSESAIRQRVHTIWHAMQDCVARGCRREGVLPGTLGVRRRAPSLRRALEQRAGPVTGDPLTAMDWVNVYAIAVNEENASGGRVVTAPTNGAAGIIPAVLHYYWQSCPGASDDGIIRFLLTAGTIGILYKENASISGAEVGCQGEVGVACSMAAAGLAEVLGGTVAQVEEAAEIGMEHNLGLTCDPVAGLVQIPCIERNAMAAVKAINAARLALGGSGTHHVSLDSVIKTMRETGADMKAKYKESARGGLAVNVTQC